MNTLLCRCDPACDSSVASAPTVLRPVLALCVCRRWGLMFDWELNAVYRAGMHYARLWCMRHKRQRCCDRNVSAVALISYPRLCWRHKIGSTFGCKSVL